MTIEEALAALGAATAGCTLRDLDAKNADDTAVLISSAGLAIRISPSAAAVVRALWLGDAHDAIAARFDARPAVVAAALVQLSARIRDSFAAVALRRPPGFLAQRKLVSGARVARWVRPLTGLLAPWVVALAVVLSFTALAETHAGLVEAPTPPLALWSGFALGLALMFIHELGHASACRRYGAPVGDIGCALYLIYPALFCDVTSTWGLPRRARVVVDLAGVYFQLVATALVAVLWRITDSDTLAATVRISIATMVLNLLPLVRLDGYWLLADLLGVIDLRAQQRVVAAALWARLRGRRIAMPWTMWTTVAIAAYGLASAWFVVSIMIGFLPRVISEAGLLPARLGNLAAAIMDGHCLRALRATGELASSLVIGWIALALAREVLRRGLRLVRRAPS